MNSIVVGTDGSETAALAVREAADIARSLGAHVHIVSVLQPLSGVKVAGAGSGPEGAGWAGGPSSGLQSLPEAAAGAVRTRGVEVSTCARKGGRAGGLGTPGEGWSGSARRRTAPGGGAVRPARGWAPAPPTAAPRCRGGGDARIAPHWRPAPQPCRDT